MRDTKDPDIPQSYKLDWSDYLSSLSGNPTISSVNWTVPAGITNDTTSFDSTTATIQLSGGTLGSIYPVVCEMTPNTGSPESQTILIEVVNA